MVKDKKEDVGKNNKQFYDRVLTSGKLTNFLTGKGARRIATAMIYERIGNSEVFIGGYPLLKGTFDIGEYCVIDYKKPYFIDSPSSEVYTLCKDKKLNKIIEFVKYGEDDFRIRRKLNETFYKTEETPIMEEVELIEDGERIVDEDNKPIKIKIEKKDKNGKIMYKKKEKPYTEPLGVTQTGRKAISIHAKKKLEIKAFKEQNQSFFQKYGAVIVPVVGLAIVGMMFLMGMKYVSDSWHDGVQSLTGEIKDASENIKWWQQPDALDTISQAVVEKTDEKNAPPVN